MRTTGRWTGRAGVWATMVMAVAAIVAAARWGGNPMPAVGANGPMAAGGIAGRLLPPNPELLPGEHRGPTVEEAVDALEATGSADADGDLK